MIRALSFLLFVSAVLADTQKCINPNDKNTYTYTSFAGELKDGQTTGEFYKLQFFELCCK